MPRDIEDDEFAIVLRPLDYTGDGSDWSGNVSTKLVMSPDCELPVGILGHVYDVATMMATFLDVAADYPDIYELVEERRDELLGMMDGQQKSEEEPVEVQRDGNVYTLTRWTKTEGNA